jgi:hypothetical protein
MTHNTYDLAYGFSKSDMLLGEHISALSHNDDDITEYMQQNPNEVTYQP